MEPPSLETSSPAFLGVSLFSPVYGESKGHSLTFLPHHLL